MPGKIIIPSELPPGEEKKLLQEHWRRLQHGGPSEQPKYFEVQVKAVPDRFRARDRLNLHYPGVAVMVLDREGRIVQMNDEMLRWRNESDLGQVYWDVVPNLKAEGRDRDILEVMETGKPKVVRDKKHVSTVRGVTYQDLAIIPIVEGKDVVGSVVRIVDKTKEKLFEQIDTDILAVSDISSGLTFKDVMQNICDAAWRLSSPWKTESEFKSKSGVRLVSEGKVTDVFASGPPTPEQGGWTVPQLESFSQAVGPTSRVWQRMVETGEPVVLNRGEFERAVESGLVSRESVMKRGIYSMVSIPLCYQGNLIGDLRVYNGSWGKEDVEFLVKLANKAAIVIQNVRGHARVVSQRDTIDLMRRKIQTSMEVISHDVRGVLISARSGLGRISGEADTPPDIVKRVRAEGDSLGVAQQILETTLEDLKSGTGVLKTSEVDFTQVLGGISGILRERAAFKGLQLVLTHLPDLPHVSGDPVKIQQILLNLVGNAVKFTEKGGRIVLQARPRGNRLVVDVSDTGRGIPKDKISCIFDEGVQVSEDDSAVDASGSRRGYGLGLATVKSLVFAHGGSVRVVSGVQGSNEMVCYNPDGKETTISAKDSGVHGTTFQFTLPLQNSVYVPEAETPTVDLQDVVSMAASDRSASQMEDACGVHLQVDIPTTSMPTCIKSGFKGWNATAGLIRTVLLPGARETFGLKPKTVRVTAVDGSPAELVVPPVVKISAKPKVDCFTLVINNNNPEHVITPEEQASIIGLIRPPAKRQLDESGAEIGFERTENGTAFVVTIPKQK